MVNYEKKSLFFITSIHDSLDFLFEEISTLSFVASSFSCVFVGIGEDSFVPVAVLVFQEFEKKKNLVKKQSTSEERNILESFDSDEPPLSTS